MAIDNGEYEDGEEKYKTAKTILIQREIKISAKTSTYKSKHIKHILDIEERENSVCKT